MDLAMPASVPSGRPVAAAGTFLLVALAATATLAQTAQTAADGVKLFEDSVRPVLELECFACHSDPERAQNDLLLTSRAGLLRGGERGPVLASRNPDESLLLRAVEYHDEQLQMPPSGRLAEADIDAIRQWVRLGAPFGGDEDDLDEVERVDEFEITEADRAWWSVRPIARPAPPEVDDAEWPANPVDSFLLARLEGAGLEPPAEADRRTLIRRAAYDLTGLPPTPDEIEAFENDPREDAWPRLIDRLLASPHYGERWGRHWLDLVRYAETDGYERDRLKPSAWRYRDWVVDALNADMPYDEFLTHQLAGDEIEQPTAASIIATGYLRLGIWDDEPTDTELAQYDDLDSILDTTSRVMLGMSIGCARCHDHRGDPIPQTDYYRMLSFFRGIAPYKVGGGNEPTPENYVDRIPADLGVESSASDALDRWRAEHDELLAAARQHEAELLSWASETEREGAEAAAHLGLVAHLPLDETLPLVAADSRGGLHGRVDGVEVGVDGIRGSAFRFDGKDDAIRMPRPVSEAFTVSVWFRTEAKAPGGVAFQWRLGAVMVDSRARNRGFGLAVVGDGYVVGGAGSGLEASVNVASGPGYNDGVWHHAALVREAKGELRLYVDGVLQGEAEGPTGTLAAADFLDLGTPSQTKGGSPFAGSLDELRVFNRALTEREIRALHVGVESGGAGLALASRLGGRESSGETQAARAYLDAVEAIAAQPRPEADLIEVLLVKETGAEAPPTHVLIRGNPHAPAERVEPGFPLILGDADPQLAARNEGSPTTGRRLALARWIADEGNLRTSRVMANRLWQHHFGRGLAPTPNDFGRFGEEPTHPELLDWLASEFTAQGWSIKSMHRLLMTSRAYRMSSRPPEGALAADPENDLFSRFSMRRLTAEEIRDSVLAATGRLNLEMGGPSVHPPIPEEVLATASRPDAAWGEATPEQASRRSIYIHVKRSLLHPLLESLDLADTDSTCPVRFTTTQPTQALMMLNGDFMGEQSRALAERFAGVQATLENRTLEERVGEAFRTVLGRRPQPVEVARGVDLVRELEREEGFDAVTAFAGYSLLLLNLNEFVYLD